MNYECLDCNETFEEACIDYTAEGMFEYCPICQSENIEERDE